MVSDLIRSPAVRLLHARQDHAICLRLAASYRLRIAAGETDQRAAHAWALGLARRWRLLASELSQPCALPG
ncbi:hypothetical protein FV226_26515 [Methylobacterium sp. WL12]|uniref:hypothetical protein n=1 Tax=Methylobacterium sp. WL12 TaxID=2603890 RepID=UPI0011C7AEC3|nr:hypothetical protein [Methylobacterium sp. WL12]TXM64447.1 hypothetical protein FV226_26515 [Methylobacterium sp. WL12]